MESNINNLDHKIKSIFNTIDKISIKLEKIESKIQYINTLFVKYEFNKNLKLNKPISYLKFQVSFLLNEKKILW